MSTMENKIDSILDAPFYQGLGFREFTVLWVQAKKKVYNGKKIMEKKHLHNGRSNRLYNGRAHLPAHSRRVSISLVSHSHVSHYMAQQNI
jgi:hypothetical protein